MIVTKGELLHILAKLQGEAMGHVTKSSRCLVFLLTWMFFGFLPSTTGSDIELKLQDRVFVALKGENLSISYQLKKPANLTVDPVACFDPLHKPIYHFVIPAAAANEIHESLVLRNIALSGEYYCQYKNAKASWFLRVRDSGYKEVWSYSETEVVIVSLVTGLLLIFSVGGSIYVFRGNWECCKTQNKSQNSDEKQGETVGTANGESSQSTSFYASLDARPRSVYDVLDHSAAAPAGGERDQTNAKTPKKKEAKKKVRDAPQKQEEGMFECVYENC